MSMSSFLRRCLGIAEPPEAPGAADRAQKMEELNAMAPLKAAAASAVTADTAAVPASDAARSFIFREPVLNREQRIVGYEFTLMQGIRSRIAEKRSMVRRLYDDSLLRSLCRGDVATLLEHRLAFVHLTPTSMQNPQLEALPRNNSVLVLTPGESDTVAEFAAGLQRATALGFKVGTVLQPERTEFEPLLANTDFIQVDATVFDGVTLNQLVSRLRAARQGQARPLGLIARNLATDDEFNFCYQCGFDQFLGTFISSRRQWRPAKSDINRLRVLEILNLIRSDAEFDAIAEVLKTEPVLSYKLLRYINSAGVGMQREVTAMAQALVVLGRDRFYRWLSLLLFNFGSPGWRERMLSEQALTRGRFMELLAGQGRVPPQPEHLFMTGMFSLLDVLTDQPMAEVLGKVSLPEAVRGALSGEAASPFHGALELARALESFNGEIIEACAVACAVDDDQVTTAHLAALAWCEQISRAE